MTTKLSDKILEHEIRKCEEIDRLSRTECEELYGHFSYVISRCYYKCGDNDNDGCNITRKYVENINTDSIINGK